MKERSVIVHYHFFKNAGTSLDHVLKKAFPDGWNTLEADASGPVTPERILTYLQEHPECRVLSSHTAQLSVLSLDNIRVYPILFLRHPLDRVLSVYHFERKQTEDTEGSIHARKLDLADFVAWRLSRKNDCSFQNFQSHRLAGLYPEGGSHHLSARALQGLQKLPFVGLVESFDASLSILQSWLEQGFPGVHLTAVKLNTTQSTDSTLVDRLGYLKKSLGVELYRKLVEENQADLMLHQYVSSMYTGYPSSRILI